MQNSFPLVHRGKMCRRRESGTVQWQKRIDLNVNPSITVLFCHHVFRKETTVNYLFHLYLSPDTPAELVGSILGDFVKGRLDTTYAPDVTRGIVLHRRVDSFAYDHPAVRRSRLRIDDSYGHCRGVLVDVYYDHFLARTWDSHHPVPLPVFARHVYAALQSNLQGLPPSMQQMATRMIAHDWLTSYRDEAVVARVLERLSLRLRRPNPLASGAGELRRNYAGLEEDFEEFRGAAVAYVGGLAGEI